MSIQLIIIIAYFAISIIVGVAMSRGTNTSSKFHGTQLGVAAIVCASAGEWLGGTATTGGSEYGFLYGLSGAWYTIANGLGVLFLGLFFAKLYINSGITWMFSCAITFGTIAYHFVIRFLAPPVICIFTRKNMIIRNGGSGKEAGSRNSLRN